jgi:hypothetical protein
VRQHTGHLIGHQLIDWPPDFLVGTFFSTKLRPVDWAVFCTRRVPAIQEARVKHTNIYPWGRVIGLVLLLFATPTAPALAQQAPIGFFDSADDTWLRGWARDPDYSGPIHVHVYVQYNSGPLQFLTWGWPTNLVPI